jgi:hypothetical protein
MQARPLASGRFRLRGVLPGPFRLNGRGTPHPRERISDGDRRPHGQHRYGEDDAKNQRPTSNYRASVQAWIKPMNDFHHALNDVYTSTHGLDKVPEASTVCGQHRTR